ncbi:PREDICTED: F-box protein FBW2-like [Nelumbo nucifera]|uniref:F-box protein FBW2-like n=1 Tax=Nelumbo nucifera TaxID=4432 RepID=A0A1U8AMI8_NELNU|nr:PREDICTED: F-box protein FBW2-like [Nelumbo nucifera]XP_010267287.1 PREDICTED: F-box protein FBW2-like [Nelumbo nucifera]XP_010267295.1 PREDICTED: F-box protein FBW2-like [Nelumbo nucifera]XP_010267304.1 PREDICTED: F-box protein FBW2-like [Nelumbo nucifera]XP_010267313.1 PREDICTED: F-box protein FBW2-like [Nelumbo nucifera]
MEEGGEFRCWDELIPDALGLIFKNLSLQEILTVIPRVCKSWNRAIMGPYCWQEIDIKEWSLQCQPEQLDRMLKMLITRSCGSLRKLCVSGLPNEPLLSFIADHSASLQTLHLPMSEISDSMVEQVAGRLSTISFLDLSYCKNIGARALEAIGKHCKLLVGLKRVMHPLEVADKISQNDEAHAIATTMPKLKHLEMAYLLITTGGLLEILLNCRELEFLDVRGCWDVKLDEKFLKEKCPGLKVLGPLIVDCYERNYWDDFSDCSDSSGYLAWDFVAGELYDGEISDGVWDDEERFGGLELSFYEGFGEDVAFGWPQSP